MDQSIVTQVVEVLVPAAGGLLLALVSWALMELTRFVRGRTQSESINDALARVCYMVETTVAKLNQTVVDDLRAAAADGRISAEDAKAIRDRALAAVYLQLPDQVLEIAAKGVTDLTRFVEDRIERAVREQQGNP